MRGVAVLGLMVFGAELLEAGERPEYLQAGHEILFLGDSITASGEFIAMIEARLRVEYGEDIPDLINLGLPSETCTGLSEPDHPFPRPNVHERLGRALAKSVPDVVVACYGMNDGIYYPFDQKRFEAYQAGIRALVRQVQSAGAQCLLLTPPAFDPDPFRRAGKLLPRNAGKFAWFAIYEGYDAVIQRYADWVMSAGDLGVPRVNTHDPIRDYLASKRREQPDFALSQDGVHINREGHKLLAQAVLGHWGVDFDRAVRSELEALCHEKHKILHAAWLTHVGHLRPGGKDGLPILEAEKRAVGLDVKIRQLLD